MPFFANLIFLSLIVLSLIGSHLDIPAVLAADQALPGGQKPTDAPRLTVGDITTDNRYGKTVLTLSITQEIQEPEILQVPILIKTGMADIRFTRMISARKTTLDFLLPDPPLQVILDPGQDLTREMDPSEVPPLWSRFLDAKEKTVVLGSAESENIFAPLLEYLRNMPVKVTTTAEIKNADLGKTAILFLGAGNVAARTLFARPALPARGFTLDVRNNPLDPRQVAVLAVSSSAEETKAAVKHLQQYRGASFIHFRNGEAVRKQQRKSQPGQRYTLETLPLGAPVAAVQDFAGIIDKLEASRVVYVGETHTSAADHLLQLRIIQALFKKDPHLAIGMEMFPDAAQQELDTYVMSDAGVDEKDFLKKSRYFQVWGYDWRLFRDIFNFARMNRIPVIGLNLDRNIVSTIFKTGSTDALTPEQQQLLPADRDLDLPGYTDRLSRMHDAHKRDLPGTQGAFSGFIQAQGVWDETMAQNIAAYLACNPATRMVVLAGVQHVRKDSGIPPRVARRIKVSQSSVVNILSENAPADITDIADYIFMAEPVSLPPAARLGIILEQGGTGDSTIVRITGLSPHGKAGAAGLRENDILLAIDGHPVYDMDDVRIAMLDSRPGETIRVRVRRGMEQSEALEYDVAAYAPKEQHP